MLAKVQVPLNLSFFESGLATHPNKEFVAEVLCNIENGSDIGYKGPDVGRLSHNWPSAYQFATDVTSNVSENLSKGRVVGPWTDPPCNDFVASPLGAFARKGTGKVRVICDLSYPPGSSINDHIDKDSYSLSYITVDSVAELCMEYSEPPYVAKSDIRSAFTHCLVRPQDWPKLGFEWQGLYYMYTHTPFGLRSSPYNYNLIADAVEFIALSRGAGPHLRHYLDDSVVIASNYSACKRKLEIFNETATLAGLEIQTDKCTDPSQTMEFLGIQIDTVNSTLSISQERLTEICDKLNRWRHRRTCSKRQLLSLIGKLSFAARVIRAGRTFLRRLIDLSKKVKFLHYKIKLNASARADMEWWLASVASHNGVSMFPEPWIESTCINLWTDASNLGGGCLVSSHWFTIAFEGKRQWMTNMPICWREMYVVVRCLATFGPQLSNSRIIMHIDNQVVCYALNNGTTKCPHMMELVRTMYHILVMYNMECRAQYITTKDNVSADALSRFDMSTFRELNPNADVSMTPPWRIRYFDTYI